MGEESVKGVRTRRHAMWLGVAVFPLSVVAVYALGWCFAPNEVGLSNSRIPLHFFPDVARSFAACFPLAFFVGFFAACDAYRFASGRPVPVGPIVLVVLSVPLGIATKDVFTYVLLGVISLAVFQTVHRAVLMDAPPLRYWRFFNTYVVLLLVSLWHVGRMQGMGKLDLRDALPACAFAGLLAADALVVGRVNIWLQQERIDRESGARLQFSLLALCALILSWGLYLALLAWLFPGTLR